MNDKDFAWIDVADLVPWIKNPRHNDQAVQPVAASIEEFGFGAPIVIQAKTNMIIAGHTRLKAAMRLGWSKVPCRILEITDRNAERLAIADNKTNEIAQWDEEQLEEILGGFEPEELDNLGFSQDELDELTNHNNEPPPKTVEPPPKAFVNQTFELLKGDCLERIKEIQDGSIDSIVTDPPYEIDFMGKGWDRSGIAYNVELWRECLRVLKPGGHLIGFCATRTIHGMTSAIEEAGFQIRDMIMWCFESGFPKSTAVDQQIDRKLGKFDQRPVLKVNQINPGNHKLGDTVGQNMSHNGKDGNGGYNDPNRSEWAVTAPATPEAAQWFGWGTALKPAYEPAILARKPLTGTIAENFLEHGVGGLNIDGSRFPYGDPIWFGSSKEVKNGKMAKDLGVMHDDNWQSNSDQNWNASDVGRFPANIVRFKKTQRSEREAGLEHLDSIKGHEAVDRKEGSKGVDNPRAGAGRTADRVKNHHPTVKPIKLMRWLCKLITPPNGTVFDPFLGSGSTACAAVLEGFNSIGCEITEDYHAIIEARVEHAKHQYLKEYEHGTKDKTK